MKIMTIKFFFLLTFFFISSAQAQPVTKSFADLSERLLPTVVNISTTQVIKQRQKGAPPFEEMPQFPPGSPFEDFFRDFFGQPFPEGGQEDAPLGRAPQRPSSLGSGFVIDAKNGYIITNNHVVADADEIKVIFTDDVTVDAKLIGRDEKTDIAVLKIETTRPLIAAQWGNSDDIRVGDWILAIGNPFGLGGSVTAGIVSARQRNINAGPYDDFIQTDASINRGNSGGPMFDMAGRVIGINTAIFSPSGGSVGIGFAIPSALAKPVVEQIIEYGRTRRGWIGVRIQHITDEIAEGLGLAQARGALVSSVAAEGPAKEAGVQVGDVIIRFDGKDVTEMRRLPRIVAETAIEKTVPLVVWRAGKEVQLRIKVGELEAAEEQGLVDPSVSSAPQTETEDTSQIIDRLGLRAAELNDALRSTYGFENAETGIIITQILPNSIAVQKNIQDGDLIVEVNQQAVKTIEELKKAVDETVKSKRKSILLLISRGGDMRFVAIPIAQD